MYSLCILMVDIIWVIFNTVCAVVQAIYELFKPPPLKSVRFETAMVSLLNIIIIHFNKGAQKIIVSTL